jgi:hypothetical protein
LVFSNFSVQRGTTQMFGAVAAPWVGCAAAGMAPVAKALRLERSNTALDITELLLMLESVISGRRGWRLLLIQFQTESRDLWDVQSATPRLPLPASRSGSAFSNRCGSTVAQNVIKIPLLRPGEAILANVAPVARCQHPEANAEMIMMIKLVTFRSALRLTR